MFGLVAPVAGQVRYLDVRPPTSTPTKPTRVATSGPTASRTRSTCRRAPRVRRPAGRRPVHGHRRDADRLGQARRVRHRRRHRRRAGVQDLGRARARCRRRSRTARARSRARCSAPIAALPAGTIPDPPAPGAATGAAGRRPGRRAAPGRPTAAPDGGSRVRADRHAAGLHRAGRRQADQRRRGHARGGHRAGRRTRWCCRSRRSPGRRARARSTSSGRTAPGRPGTWCSASPTARSIADQVRADRRRDHRRARAEPAPARPSPDGERCPDGAGIGGDDARCIELDRASPSRSRARAQPRTILAGVDLTVHSGESVAIARPVRLRQEHAAQPDRPVRPAGRRPVPAGRAGHHPAARAQGRRAAQRRVRLRLPAVLPAQAPDRGAERGHGAGQRPGLAAAPQAAGQGHGGARPGRHRAPGQAPAGPAVRRRAAAGGDRPGPGAPAAGCCSPTSRPAPWTPRPATW